MLEFLPPAGMSLDQGADILAERLAVTPPSVEEIGRTFYDTFDGLLHAEGKVCVYEDRRLRLVDLETGRELVSADMAQPTLPLQACDLKPGPLRQELSRVIELRALLPLVHVHTRARRLNLLDGLQKTVVRITLEQPTLIEQGAARPLRPRLRLTPVRGYDGELASLIQRLESEFDFKRVDQPLVDEAVRAAGLTPGGVSSKVDVPLNGDEDTASAAAKVLLRLLEVIEANLNGAIAGTDIEFLHDLRVAVRRSRSVQREFKRAFPSAALGHYRAEFRRIQQATGEARDLDVYVLEFDRYRRLVPRTMRADLDALLDVLRERRLDARRKTAATLRSERTANLLGEWRVFLEAVPGDSRPIGETAAERISKVYRRMVKMGRVIDLESPPERYHELRKKGKELRYLLELFGSSLYAGEVVKPMVKSLKGLQDVLGRHQDREVQTAMLISLREAVSERSGGRAALMAMGALVQSLSADERAARKEFAEQFEAFSGKAQRRAVKETFG